MAAIMEDDENADEERPGQDGHWQRQPDGNHLEPVHQVPQSRIGDQRIAYLPEAAPNRGLLIFGDNLLPGRSVGPVLAWRGSLVICHNSRATGCPRPRNPG